MYFSTKEPKASSLPNTISYETVHVNSALKVVVICMMYASVLVF